MPIAELEFHCVVAHKLPAEDSNSWELVRAVSSVALAQDIYLASILRTGRMFAEKLSAKEVFGSVGPGNGDLIANELHVFRGMGHGKSGVCQGFVRKVFRAGSR